MQLNSQFLKTICDPFVLPVNVSDVNSISDAMFRMLYAHQNPSEEKIAVGLAANQVGIPKRLIVVNYAGFKEAMVNPVIEKFRGGTNIESEGCLSFPGKLVSVERYKIIVVSWLAIDGTPKRIKIRGLLARIVQHEIDHLDGIGII
jgi:peptide deformylase